MPTEPTPVTEASSSLSQGDASQSDTNGTATSASSPFSAPQISLPKGGGAISGIGEKFAANSATGTGQLTVPLPTPPGRSGFGLHLQLTYDSGSGNGIFGMGASLSLPSITRKTDKGLPKYRLIEEAECDVFLLSGAEDLVPALIEKEKGRWVDDELELEGHRVKRYRPRIEGLFARIERWTRLADGDEHWRSISKDNTLSVYGRDQQSRIIDPENRRRVFSWLISESYDEKGNAIFYEYKGENRDGVDRAQSSEATRGHIANRYPKRIKYGNRRPLQRDNGRPNSRASHLERQEPENAEWMFEVVFDYGDEPYCAAPRDPEGREWVRYELGDGPNHPWQVRLDPFSRYRSRFEMRTYRLCQRILFLHHFPEELGTDNCLIRSLDFDYKQNPTGSFLSKVTQSGYVRHSDGRYLKKSMPPVELDYTVSPLASESYRDLKVKEVDPLSLENLPAGIDESNYRWVDLDGEGIAGVLAEQGSEWFYKPNAGNAHFGPTELVRRKPSLAALNHGRQQLLDISGGGALSLVEFDSFTPGFYDRTLSEGWGGFRTFRSVPVLNWKNPNLRFVDVTGDGIADILITENDAFLWHESLLEEGFGPAVRVTVPTEETKGPHLIFADGIQSVYLADMSGDGLSDLVRIRNGEVCYWPNLGYGHFGSKVVMQNAPWFEDQDLFAQSRVRLADTDGNGCADILYLGTSGIQIYLNESGNGWSSVRRLPQFPPLNPQSSISVVDFLGRGTSCVLWSSTLPEDRERSLRYLDLMGGEKPHLLVRVRNNRGAETRIQYASSTEFYLADKAAGDPWITRLPFPVQVVKSIETYDFVSRNRFLSSYRYHDGFFDPLEREFRGFGMVEELDTDEIAALDQSEFFPKGNNVDPASSLPPVLTKTWFHTGVFLGNGRVSRHMAHQYYREPLLSQVEETALTLDDTILPPHLNPEEAREACRALKGSMLRQEVYALDGKEESARPYTVVENNSTIRTVQRQQNNLHAVFFTHPRESIKFEYERRLYPVDGERRADPRVTHNFNLKLDDFGNVLQSAAIGYGRRFPDPSGLLSEEDHQKQRQILATLQENTFTNAIAEPHAYRSPVPAEARNYELIGIRPNARFRGTTNLFRFAEIKTRVAQASDGKHELTYEDSCPNEETPFRRLISATRSYYRADNLDRILPLGLTETLALPGESFRLALTPGLLSEVYRGEDEENLIADREQLMKEQGGYEDLDHDGRWWTPSGRVFYAAEPCEAREEAKIAQAHFFQPRRFVDPFLNPTVVTYDRHDLLPVRVRDAVENAQVAQIDYRVLSPFLLTDQNHNRSEVAFDALGMVVGTAVMGKAGQDAGDSLEGFISNLDEPTILEHLAHPLDHPDEILRLATTRMVYDLFAYCRTQNQAQPEPPVVYTLMRETHVADLAPGERSRLQHSFAYSDGFGRAIQKKIQAEPGPLRAGEPEVNPRWVGSGWTIFNNKGKPVRQYEPFFTALHTFEFAQAIGVSTVLFYDPLERTVATLHPNHTYEKVVSEPWRQDAWDVNDTVLESNPGRDMDVGDFFQKLSPKEYLPTWYEQRRDGRLGPEEQGAAEKTTLHANTPTRTYLDSLGRTFLAIAHNRVELDAVRREEYFATRTELDIQSNQRSILDALGRRVIRYDYNLLNVRLRQISIDAGTRWTLTNVIGKVLLSWNSRSYRLRHQYDEIHRPTKLYVSRGNEAEILAEQTVYGEGQPDDLMLNLRNKPYRLFDGAGMAANERFDFKGNLLTTSRQLLENYRDEADWSESPHLEAETFRVNTSYDALNRPVTLTTPDSSIARPRYNESNLLESLSVQIRGAEEATPIVTFVNYNPKGQREIIEYGNGASTHYQYDRLTNRTIHLETRRHRDQARLQDLHYTFDPLGNITSTRDDAQQTNYFNNQVVTPSSSFAYDPLYRLIAADGREHASRSGDRPTGEEDLSRMNLPLPSDGHAIDRYREHYEYDAVGNILRLLHSSRRGNWSRDYRYEQSGSASANNRLAATEVGQLREVYSYDADGNTTSMPHLPQMEWDFKDQLHATQSQIVHSRRGEKTYYVYDSSGKRVRKVSEQSSGAKRYERIYLGSFEVYRRYDKDGAPQKERETLHVMDDGRRLALVETETIRESRPIEAPVAQMRVQFEKNLGSSVLELDDQASIITYEEYYPYGSTSFEAVRADREVARKRYRFVSKERDVETGFSFQNARYYASWLGRWTSCDPKGLKETVSLYIYCRDNPVNRLDKEGTDSEWCIFCNPFSKDVEFAPGEAIQAVASDALEGSRIITGAISRGTTAAGDWVQDQFEETSSLLDEAGFHRLATVNRWAGITAATLTKTTGEVVGQAIAAGPNAIEALHSGGVSIGTGAGRWATADNWQDRVLGTLEILSGLGDGAQVALQAIGMTKSWGSGTIESTGNRSTQVGVNRAHGKVFEGTTTEARSTPWRATENQVKIRPNAAPGRPANYTFVIDDLEKSKITGTHKLVESKGSATASLSKNQKPGFPLFERFGGTIEDGVGTFAPKGMQLPPSAIKIVRPLGLFLEKVLPATILNAVRNPSPADRR